MIERKPYKDRVKRTDYPETKSFRDEICEQIDAARLRKPKNFDDLIRMLQEQGYEYKAGKYPAVRGKGQKQFVRFRSLGENYSLEVLSAVIAGEKAHAPKQTKKARTRSRSRQNHQTPQMSFLIDIQQKLQEGKGRRIYLIIPGLEPTSAAVQRSLTAHQPIYPNPRFSSC